MNLPAKINAVLRAKLRQLFAIVLFFGATLSWAQGIDIIGIELGMSPAQVSAILQKHEPEMKLNQTGMVLADHRGAEIPDTQYTNSIWGNIRKGEKNEAITVNFAAPPSANVVQSVYRRKNFTSVETAPTFEATTAALTTKYQEPSFSVAGTSFLWRYDGEDNVHSDASDQECFSLVGRFANSSGSKQWFPPNVACGTAVWITVVKNHSNDKLVSGLSSALVNPDLVKENENNTNQLAQDYINSVKQQEADAASQKAGPVL